MAAYVHELLTNVKAVHPDQPIRVRLAPKTILTGKNGEGRKSAVVQSLQLVASGTATGVGGSDASAAAARILRLAPSTEEDAEVFVQADFADDMTDAPIGHATFRVRRQGGRAKSPEASNLPVRPFMVRPAVRDLLSGDVTRVRSSLLRLVFDLGLNDGDPLSFVAPEWRASVKPFLEAGDLGEAETAASAQAAAQNRRAKDLLAQAETLETAQREQAQPPLPSAQPSGTATRVAELNERIAEAVAAQQEWEAIEAALRPEDPENAADDAPIPARVHALGAAALGEGRNHECPWCLTPIGTELFASIMGWANAATAAANAAKQAAANARDRAKKDWEHAKTNADAWAAEVSLLRQDLAALEGEARGRLLAAASMRNAAPAADMIQSLREEARRAKEDATHLSAVAAAARTALTQQLASVVQRLVDIIRPFVPSDMGVFDVALADFTRQAADVGLRDATGRLRTALSGVEQIVVEAAIGRALAETVRRSNDTLPVWILLDPEDRGWDMQTLEATLTVWADFPGQVVLASPYAPPNLPAPWVEVTVGTPCETPLAARGAAESRPFDAPGAELVTALRQHPDALADAIATMNAKNRADARRRARSFATTYGATGIQVLQTVLQSAGLPAALEGGALRDPVTAACRLMDVKFPAERTIKGRIRTVQRPVITDDGTVIPEAEGEDEGHPDEPPTAEPAEPPTAEPAEPPVAEPAEPPTATKVPPGLVGILRRYGKTQDEIAQMTADSAGEFLRQAARAATPR